MGRGMKERWMDGKRDEGRDGWMGRGMKGEMDGWEEG